MAGDLFALFPPTVNKLYLDTEARVHAQLTRISHEFLDGLRWGERETGRKEGLRNFTGLYGILEKQRRGSAGIFSIALWTYQAYTLLSDSQGLLIIE